MLRLESSYLKSPSEPVNRKGLCAPHSPLYSDVQDGDVIQLNFPSQKVACCFSKVCAH